VRLLLDTHVLLWAAESSDKLSRRTKRLLSDPANTPVFSTVSLWEIVIKRSLGRNDLQVDPNVLRQGLLTNGYEELPITSLHALAVEDLPTLHKDPFDRMLLAQSRVEGLPLVTADDQLLRYPGAIQKA
jgi:PIN domain nuclease of toxin-antitoxin system